MKVAPKKTICDSQKRAPALDWTMPPFVIRAEGKWESSLRLYNFQLFRLFLHGEARELKQHPAAPKPVFRSEESNRPGPPSPGAFASRFNGLEKRMPGIAFIFGKRCWKWVPERSQLAGLLCAGGAWWEPEQCRFVDSLWQSRAWIVFNRYHSLTWQISWKVQSQRKKSIHRAVLVIVLGKLPDFELGDDDYELGCLKLFESCLNWCRKKWTN